MPTRSRHLFLPYALREALRSLRVNSWMSLAAASTVALALLVLAVFLLLASNLDNLAAVAEDQVQIKVYLADDLSDADRQAMEQRIASMEDVQRVTYVTKDQELERLRQELGNDAELVDMAMQENPLSNSFEVEPKEAADARAIAERLGSEQGATKVDYREDVVEKILLVARLFRVGGLVLAVLLGVAVIFIVQNTIRLTVFARRREISIMKLVGATDRFIQRPFVLEGLFLGLVGALLASLLVGRGYIGVFGLVRNAMPFFPLQPPDAVLGRMNGLLVALGLAVGYVGSLLSLRRYLRSGH